MKLSQVSLLLALLTACVEDPLAPDPPLPRPLIDNGEVVITGRVVRSGSATGIEGGYLRVLETKAFGRLNENGHYRIVLPASFRGRTVAVTALAIGFNARTEVVRFDRDTVTLDLAMSVNTLRFDCLVVTETGVTEAPEPGFTVTTRPVRGKQMVRTAR